MDNKLEEVLTLIDKKIEKLNVERDLLTANYNKYNTIPNIDNVFDTFITYNPKTVEEADITLNYLSNLTHIEYCKYTKFSGFILDINNSYRHKTTAKVCVRDDTNMTHWVTVDIAWLSTKPVELSPSSIELECVCDPRKDKINFSGVAHKVLPVSQKFYGNSFRYIVGDISTLLKEK